MACLGARIKTPVCPFQALSPHSCISDSLRPTQTLAQCRTRSRCTRNTSQRDKKVDAPGQEVPPAVIPLIATRWQPHRRNENSTSHLARDLRDDPRGCPGWVFTTKGSGRDREIWAHRAAPPSSPGLGLRPASSPLPQMESLSATFQPPPCAPVSKSCPTSHSSWGPGWDFHSHLTHLPPFHSALPLRATPSVPGLCPPAGLLSALLQLSPPQALPRAAATVLPSSNPYVQSSY